MNFSMGPSDKLILPIIDLSSKKKWGYKFVPQSRTQRVCPKKVCTKHNNNKFDCFFNNFLEDEYDADILLGVANVVLYSEQLLQTCYLASELGKSNAKSH